MSSELSVTVPTSEDFQRKIQDRIRAAVGELMPDEVLAKLVADGIQKAFFEPKRTVRGGYGFGSNDLIDGPCWFTDFIQKELSNQVRAAVDRWMTDNSEMLKGKIDDCLSQGILSAVYNAINYRFSSPMVELQGSLNAILARLGQPPMQ